MDLVPVSLLILSLPFLDPTILFLSLLCSTVIPLALFCAPWADEALDSLSSFRLASPFLPSLV